MEINNKGKNWIFILLGTLLSCFIAFINKYPLVYPDTGTYIYSGFNNLVFDDRPIFYGLFLRHISLAASLWFVVFAQGLIISWLIYNTLGMFFDGKKKDYLFISLILFLTLFTGYSYTVSILIPDIFSSISLLCLINLILNKNLSKIKTVLMSVFFIFSVSTQFSSIAIFVLFFLGFAVYLVVIKVRKKLSPIAIRKLLLPFYLFLGSLLMIASSNFLYSKEFKLSGSNHVFMMNHLIETGVLQDYLEDNCENHNYKICEYRNQLGWDFIWSQDSPLQKTGGWKANKMEYDEIINDIFSEPKYLVLLTHKSFEYSLKQFFTFDVQVSPPLLAPSAPYQQINWRYSDTVHEYLSSRQNTSTLKAEFVNYVQQILVLLSFGFLALIIFRPIKRISLNHELKWLICLVILYSFLSSAICSNVSTVDSRFQGRIVWLFPMLAFIVIAQNWKSIVLAFKED